MMPLAPPLLPFGIARAALGSTRLVLRFLIPLQDFDGRSNRLWRCARGMKGADHVGDKRHGVTRPGEP
jgi:hypothetical protein